VMSYRRLGDMVKFISNKNTDGNATVLFGINIDKFFMPSVANIIGVDIYGRVLRKAESANKFNNIRFMLSNETNITSAGPFDTIFAMSVLCRWEDTKGVDNCSQIYFEETLELLDKNLNVGGLLVIYNSNYLFRDSAISKKYRPLFGDEITGSGFVHKFKKTGERELQEYKEVIFQKTT
ncbi:MAG TPA: hypothetical protein PLS00_15915, partial [Niabella sp.]|nr:hypothetical protein [Niabella sp.]